MDESQFAARLVQLRTLKGVSARDMSLSIGQNHAYINTIENGKMLPSLSGFFYICDYLGITPMEFFDESSENPAELKSITEDLKKLNHHQREAVAVVVRELAKK